MSELRKSGIDILPDLSWGSHFCHFYRTKQDLLDMVVPYFKIGLENNEFCLWLVADSGLITMQEARVALENAIPDLERHILDKNIEILDGSDWYLEKEVFNLEKVMSEWHAKLKQVLSYGFVGMRASGDSIWLTENSRKDFLEYEKKLSDSIEGLPMIILCTYPLTKTSADEIFDVAHTHQFALARRQGVWEVLETPELQQAKAEINKLNEDLERRVVERTRQLVKANFELQNQITERKKAEAELRLSEDRIRLIIDTIPTMVWSVLPDGTVDFLNQRWIDHLGRSLELYKTDPAGWIHPEDAPRVREKWLRNKAAGKAYEDEMRIPNSDGEYRWFLVRTAPLRNEHGSIVKWYGVSIDIEDAKQAKDNIKKSEAHLAEAQGLAKMGSWNFDIKADKVTWSDELYNVFGIDKSMFDETHGSFLHLIDKRDRALALQTNKHTQQTGEPFTIEYHITTTKGEKRIVQERGYGEADSSGIVVRMFGTAQDITERKKAEEALQRSYEEIRRLTEHLQKVREEERTSIAREIHDELGQQLTAINMDVVWMDKKTPEEAIDQKRKLKNIIQLLNASNQSVRRILSELRPQILEDLGWLEAITGLSRQFAERIGVPVGITTPGREILMPEQVAISVFRICQEALTNIARYSQAKNISIAIGIVDEDIILNIQDDGIGFDPASVKSDRSFGILGMKERVFSLNGKFKLVSSPGNGTKIAIIVPYMKRGPIG